MTLYAPEARRVKSGQKERQLQLPDVCSRLLLHPDEVMQARARNLSSILQWFEMSSVQKAYYVKNENLKRKYCQPPFIVKNQHRVTEKQL